MRRMRNVTMTTAMLMLALLPLIALVSPDAAAPSALESNAPVVMAQPLASAQGTPLVAMPRQDGSKPMLPESGMLVLVGSALLGLAALVRRTT